MTRKRSQNGNSPGRLVDERPQKIRWTLENVIALCILGCYVLSVVVAIGLGMQGTDLAHVWSVCATITSGLISAHCFYFIYSRWIGPGDPVKITQSAMAATMFHFVGALICGWQLSSGDHLMAELTANFMFLLVVTGTVYLASKNGPVIDPEPMWDLLWIALLAIGLLIFTAILCTVRDLPHGLGHGVVIGAASVGQGGYWLFIIRNCPKW